MNLADDFEIYLKEKKEEETITLSRELEIHKQRHELFEYVNKMIDTENLTESDHQGIYALVQDYKINRIAQKEQIKEYQNRNIKLCEKGKDNFKECLNLFKDMDNLIEKIESNYSSKNQARPILNKLRITEEEIIRQINNPLTKNYN